MAMTEKNIFTKEAIKEYITNRKSDLKTVITYAQEYYHYPVPKLLIVQVGDNPASNKYVAGKIKDCEEVGIKAILAKLPEDTSVDEMRELLTVELKNVHAAIIQLPLPDHLVSYLDDFLGTMTPEQDVDGFLLDSYHYPCTPRGIVDYLISQYGEEWFVGKHAVIVGRSELVGRPLAKMLLDNDCTVTVAHSKTKNLRHVTSQADILVSATGKMNLINRFNIKPDVDAVINVGFAFDENGKMKGDVDVEDVMRITPNCMPIVGSTGLLTRLALLDNTVNAWVMQC